MNLVTGSLLSPVNCWRHCKKTVAGSLVQHTHYYTSSTPSPCNKRKLERGKNKGEIIADTIFPTEMERQKGLDGWIGCRRTAVQYSTGREPNAMQGGCRPDAGWMHGFARATIAMHATLQGDS